MLVLQSEGKLERVGDKEYKSSRNYACEMHTPFRKHWRALFVTRSKPEWALRKNSIKLERKQGTTN